MTKTMQKRVSAITQLRRCMALYKRPAEQRKAALALQRDVSAVLMPYLKNYVAPEPIRGQLNITGIVRGAAQDVAQRATETQQAGSNVVRSGALDTLAEQCADAGACQSPATCSRGAGGVCALAGALKANSFTPSGTKTQCRVDGGTTGLTPSDENSQCSPGVDIDPNWDGAKDLANFMDSRQEARMSTIGAVIAKYRKAANGQEKAPRPEEAQGAVAAVVAEAEVSVVQAVWPSECEVLITGSCPNPRLMAGCILEGEAKRKGRAVSLWKTWKQERAGMVVRAKLERGSGREALYAVVYPEKAVVAPMPGA